ncbi:MAG: hypothetical protein SGI99_05575 [Pseudomonadota bacterium]|nr:hypothetical protein [Pseudomonadota bacterium]
MMMNRMLPARLRKAVAMTLGVGLALVGPSFVLAQTFPGAGLGAIPDNAPAAGLNTTFAVSGAAGALTNLSVSITFSPVHTWVGDLTVTLLAPGGSPSATLFVRPGFTGTGFGLASDVGGPYVFVDPAAVGSTNFWTAGATNPVPAGTYFTSGPNSGTGTPFLAPFAALTPAQINGTWTLSFTDSGAADTGSVSATSMTIAAGPPPQPFTSTPTSGTTVTLPTQPLAGAATTTTINFQNPNAVAGTITCTAPAATQFTVAPIPLPLPATGNANVTVTYSSAVANTFNGTLNCAGSGGEAFTFPLSGTTGSPITSTPTSGTAIAMAAFTLGGAATTSTINFQNPNAAAGTVTCTAPAAPEFTVAPIPLSVPGMGNASVTVSFSSAAAGPFNGTLNCTGSGAETFTFPLSGTASAVPVTSTPVSGSTITVPTFTLGGAATTTVINFQNPGAAAATVTCTAPAAPEFTVAPNPLTVPATGNANLTVSFSSTVAGTFTSTLNCTGSGGEVFSFPLSGTAGAFVTAVPTMGSEARWLLALGLFGIGLLLVRQRNA